MELSQVRALRKNLIVFSVPIKRKSISGLYLSNTRRSSYFGGEDVWIIAIGNKVREHVAIGQKAIVNDGMELEPSDLELWDAFKDLDLFKELALYVKEVDGEVRTQIITEDSLLAVYE